jgi:hypothetical protein
MDGRTQKVYMCFAKPQPVSLSLPSPEVPENNLVSMCLALSTENSVNTIDTGWIGSLLTQLIKRLDVQGAVDPATYSMNRKGT